MGTTKTTIKAVRERTHWNSPNIRPRDPVLLGLCTQISLNQVIARNQPDTGVAAKRGDAAPAEPGA